MKKIIFLILNSFFLILFVSPAWAQAPAAATPLGTGAIIKFLDTVGTPSYGSKTTDFATSNPNDSLALAIGRVINWVLGLLGIILTLLILYAGFLWFSAGGNEEKVTKAKGILTNAIIGLVIVMGAYAISYFVFYRLTLAVQENITAVPN